MLVSCPLGRKGSLSTTPSTSNVWRNLMTFLTQNCCQGMPEKCLSVVETALGRCCPPKLKPKPKRSRS